MAHCQHYGKACNAQVHVGLHLSLLKSDAAYLVTLHDFVALVPQCSCGQEHRTLEPDAVQVQDMCVHLMVDYAYDNSTTQCQHLL